LESPTVLTGALDQYAADGLKTKALLLLDADEDAVFDFSEVERMHAAALQVLLALHKDLEPKGRKVVLKAVDPAIRKLFRISGTEEFFQFSDGSK
jgi:anti-anti-sigma factor